MTIFGKRLSEYLGLTKVFVVLILLVGLTRLALSLAGVPNEVVRWISVTVVFAISVIYSATRVYTTGFGGYKQLLPVVAILNLPAHVVAILAIAIAMATGQDNIFSAPEYAFGSDGKTVAHLAAHLFIGTTVGALVNWLIGCLVMFVAKKLMPRSAPTGRDNLAIG